MSFLAEREGFEPPEVLPSTVFKTAAIDHSAISPNRGRVSITGAKVRTFYIPCKFFHNFFRKNLFIAIFSRFM